MWLMHMMHAFNEKPCWHCCQGQVQVRWMSGECQVNAVHIKSIFFVICHQNAKMYFNRDNCGFYNNRPHFMHTSALQKNQKRKRLNAKPWYCQVFHFLKCESVSRFLCCHFHKQAYAWQPFWIIIKPIWYYFLPKSNVPPDLGSQRSTLGLL